MKPKCDVLPNREVGKEQIILIHEPDVTPFWRQPSYISAIDPDFA